MNYIQMFILTLKARKLNKLSFLKCQLFGYTKIKYIRAGETFVQITRTIHKTIKITRYMKRILFLEITLKTKTVINRVNIAVTKFFSKILEIHFPNFKIWILK